MIEPNTTQTPNKLFNGEMAKMKDTELRVVLIVTRKTLGWLKDPITGMRKEEDWISRSQLIKLSKRGHNAISRAVDNCIKMGWIEARSKGGELLDTSQKRRQIGRGNKIFYRLGIKFLSKIERDLNEDTLEDNVSQKRTLKRGHLKEDTTKETHTQKKPINKIKIINYNPKSLELAKLLYKLIKDENPSWWLQPDFDKWAEDIDKISRIDGRTFEQIEFMIRWCQDDPFWKQNILSPTKLRQKFNDLVVRVKSQKKGKEIIGL